MEHKEITKAIIRSQHCQRNWDLSREIPEDDLNLIVTAATQCPSKQNIAFYDLHVITNRQIIEAVHDQTKGFTVNYVRPVTETNSQVLANLLIIFTDRDYATEMTKQKTLRNEQTFNMFTDPKSESNKHTLMRDQSMAVGIAAGYVNLTASMLGYNTGCCACFDSDGVQKVLGIKHPPLLLMGVGFKNPNLNRRVHHSNPNFIFPTKVKQEITVNYIN